MATYSLLPAEVPKVNTKYRTIRTKLPVPESIPIFEKLRQSEPRSMLGQPPVVWDRAEDFTVYDAWGNRWIDWSSGVLVTNVGHAHPEIISAIRQALDRSLIATYVFAHESRAELCELLRSLAPRPDDYRVFLLSTGSEATENCIKLAKTYAHKKRGPKRKYIVGFDGAFHGRTMGAQLAGGIEQQKSWLVERDHTFLQVPFPDGYKNPDLSFELFLKTLADKSVAADEIAAVITESYQGIGPFFLPHSYAQDLQHYCSENDILLICDEVQSGFGRTGKVFCYEHYNIEPDLIACGKGISSSLAISAVIGRADVLDLYPPGSMTSTHSASPLPVAAAKASIKVIVRDNLSQHARELGELLEAELIRLARKHPQHLAAPRALGLVGGIRVINPRSQAPDAETATRINEACFQKGLLMFAPVGIGGECLKISPPLTITKDALCEGISVLEESIEQVCR